MSGVHKVVLLAFGLIVAGCGTDVTTFRSAAYAPRGVTLSILGVFKNGRMDPAAWSEWEPTLATAIGDETCAAAFDDRMEKTAPTLFSELDEKSRQDGITDELLDRAATSALGDAILVVEVFGKAPEVKKPADAEASSQQAAAQSQQPAGRGRGRGGRRGVNPGAAPREPPRDELEVSVGVYSIRERQVTASVQMHVDAGASSDALRELSTKLREMLHGARCARWSWQDGSEPR